MNGRGGSNGNGSTQAACAACKYQRRKCTQDCILAPYFPPEHQRQFLNAHKLFGVSNIVKIIRNLEPHEKSEAMRSIIYQSDARARDPVGGCLRIIHDLNRQIERNSAELKLIRHHLALCREQQQTAAAADGVDDVQHALLGLNVSVNPDGMNDFESMQMMQQQQNFYPYRQDCMPQRIDVQQQGANESMVVGGSYCMGSSSSTMMQDFGGECDEMKPMAEMFDRKPHFISSDGSFSCSKRVGLQEESESLAQVQEHDLKGAASFFTLKNSNASSCV